MELTAATSKLVAPQPPPKHSEWICTLVPSVFACDRRARLNRRGVRRRAVGPPIRNESGSVIGVKTAGEAQTSSML